MNISGGSPMHNMAPLQQAQTVRAPQAPQQTEAPKAAPAAERPAQSQAEAPVQPAEDMQELVADLQTESLEGDVPELVDEDTGLEDEALSDLDDLADDLGVEVEESDTEGELEELSETEDEDERDEDDEEIGDKPEEEGRDQPEPEEEQEAEPEETDDEESPDDAEAV